MSGQGGDILRVLRRKNLEDKWLKIYVNEEQPLQYWWIFNKKGESVTIHPTWSRTSPIPHQRGLCVYHMNHYWI